MNLVGKVITVETLSDKLACSLYEDLYWWDDEEIASCMEQGAIAVFNGRRTKGIKISFKVLSKCKREIRDSIIKITSVQQV